MDPEVSQSQIIIGTASWSLPPAYHSQFPPGNMALERYSKVFNGVEINSTFYNYHRPETFVRWKELTPQNFQFAIKLHRDFSHTVDYQFSKEKLRSYLQDLQQLGKKWKVLLIQFPPKKFFDETGFCHLIDSVRNHYEQTIVIEARNSSWCGENSLQCLKRSAVSLVIADPAIVKTDDENELYSGIRYFRLHGSPDIYRSSYHPYQLDSLAAYLRESKKKAWCIFDNTASGNATMNALYLLKASSLHS